MTKKISRFLAEQRPQTPCLVVDLDVVGGQLQEAALGGAGRRHLLRRQGEPGAGDPEAPGRTRLVASTRQASTRSTWCWGPGAARGADLVRQHDQEAERHRRRLRARRAALRLRFGEAELDKIAGAAPGSKVFCRILTSVPAPTGRCRASSAATSTWRASCCSRRRSAACVPHGVSFHVGSQQRDVGRSGTRRWRRPRGCSASSRSAACG